MVKSLVLLSAGLDSTVNLYEARLCSQVIGALTFDYGQRAARQEVAMAQAHCAALGISHQVVRLDFFKSFTQTALINTDAKVPVGTSVEIDDMATSTETAKAVWVPNRNGIFLNIAAGFAEGMKADWIVPGFNIEEGATFPDNTEPFLQATTQALEFSTALHVKAKCFTTHLTKTEIVRRGIELGVQFEFVWPCYMPGPHPCGECESCCRYKRACLANGLKVSFDRGVRE